MGDNTCPGREQHGQLGKNLTQTSHCNRPLWTYQNEPCSSNQLAFLSTACYDKRKSPVAQLVERSTVNRLVKGSNPFWRVLGYNEYV